MNVLQELFIKYFIDRVVTAKRKNYGFLVKKITVCGNFEDRAGCLLINNFLYLKNVLRTH